MHFLMSCYKLLTGTLQLFAAAVAKQRIWTAFFFSLCFLWLVSAQVLYSVTMDCIITLWTVSVSAWPRNMFYTLFSGTKVAPLESSISSVRIFFAHYDAMAGCHFVRDKWKMLHEYWVVIHTLCLSTHGSTTPNLVISLNFWSRFWLWL